ncbi:MAG: 2-polyprenylphenol 6-hydroxylase, partial [Rhizobium sp.]|nr:2-polyprenylphenol 6-hydroxylase [Rhizobium sp.]
MSTIGAYFRLMKLGWVLAREGVVSALPTENLPPIARFGQSLAGLVARRRAKSSAQSDNLARAVERLGPSYVKIGQFLATRPDVVGNAFAADLAQLQDRMQTFPRAEAIGQIEVSLGRPIDQLYTHFGEPIAAASIAQVHPADVVKDGVTTRVAVKVIRPGVRERFAKDLETNYVVARFQERFYPPARRLRPVEVTRMLEQTTKVEMDLRLEAAALSELAQNSKDDPGFRV